MPPRYVEEIGVFFRGDASGAVRASEETKRAVKDVSATAERENKKFEASSQRVTKQVDLMNVAVGNSAHQTKLFANVAGLIKWPAIHAGAGLAAQGVGAVGAAAVGTVSALAPLSGALAAYPALGAAVAQGLGVAKLGLSGLSEAISGDEKALAKLGPAGREFVESFNASVKPLKQTLTELAQGELLPGITRGIKAAFSPDNVGAVKAIVGDTAKALGGLAAQLGQELGDPQWARDLEVVGKNNVRWMNELGGVLIHDVLPAVRDLVVAAQPFVDWLVKSAAGMASFVGHAISAGRETGALAGFLDKTRETMSLLGGILGGLGRTFLEVGKAAYPLGHSILVALNEQAGKLAEWAQSEGGRETLRHYFAAAKPLVFEVGRLLGAVVGGVLKLTEPVKGNAGLVGFLARIRTEVLPLFETAVSGSMSQLGPALEDLVIAVAKLVGALAGSNGPLTVFVQTLAGMASGFADLLTEHPHLQEFVFTLAGMVGILKALKFAEAITGLTKLSGLFATSAVQASASTVALTGQTAATEGATAASWSLNAALRANPIGLVITALELLGVALYEAWTHSETFRDIVRGALDVVRGVVSGFVDFFGTTLPDAFGRVLDWVKGNWPLIAVLLSGPFAPLVALATDAFGIRSALVGAFDAVVGWVRDNWPLIAVLLSGPFAPLVALATNAFGVRSALVNAFTAVVGWVREHWPEIASLIALPFTPLVALATNAFGVRSALEGALSAAKKFVGERVSEIVGFFSAFPGRLGDALASIAGVFGPDGAFRRPIRNAVEWVDGRVAAIVGFWRDMPGKVGEAIRDGADAVEKAIMSIFDPLPKAVRKLLGISSPSKVFAEIGANIVHGLIEGIKREAPRLLKEAEGLAASVAGTLGEAAAPPRIGGSTSAGANVMLGQEMAAKYGWTGPEFSALLKLWYGESGWSADAYNPSSGAQGIPQMLPSAHPGPHPGFPSWPPVDAAAQISWGLNYIKGAYGDPITAYRMWLSRSPHWYETGSIFKEPNLIGVGESGPEAVIPLNERGANFLVAMIRRLLGMRTVPPGDGGDIEKVGRTLGRYFGGSVHQDLARLLAWGKEVLARLDTIIGQLGEIAAKIGGGTGAGVEREAGATTTAPTKDRGSALTFPSAAASMLGVPDRGTTPWLDIVGATTRKLGPGAVVDTSGIFDKLGRVAALSWPALPTMPFPAPSATSTVTLAPGAVRVEVNAAPGQNAQEIADAVAGRLTDDVIVEIGRRARNNGGKVWMVPPVNSTLG
jgi:phage-related protein